MLCLFSRERSHGSSARQRTSGTERPADIVGAFYIVADRQGGAHAFALQSSLCLSGSSPLRSGAARQGILTAESCAPGAGIAARAEPYPAVCRDPALSI